MPGFGDLLTHDVENFEIWPRSHTPRPAMAMFTGNDAVLPFPLRTALDRADAQLDVLIYQAFPLPKAV